MEQHANDNVQGKSFDTHSYLDTMGLVSQTLCVYQNVGPFFPSISTHGKSTTSSPRPVGDTWILA